MPYFAKLKEGNDYRFDTVTFLKDQEEEVNEFQFNHLKDSELFEVREEKVKVKVQKAPRKKEDKE